MFVNISAEDFRITDASPAAGAFECRKGRVGDYLTVHQQRKVAKTMDSRCFKINLLKAAERKGIFRLGSVLKKGKLLILCYHGFSLEDEIEWRPGLYISPNDFKKRMELIAEAGCAVLPLETAVRKLYEGALKGNEVVITIDDGFHAVHSIAADILEKHSYPYTVYVTTYHVTKNTPVFNLVVPYMFWKSRKNTVTIPSGITNRQIRVDVSSETNYRPVVDRIIAKGNTVDESGRIRICEQLARILEVDYWTLREKRIFSLMTPAQIKDTSTRGADIQLHTHRHRFPMEITSALREIEDNREILSQTVRSSLQHLCYPSGIYSPKQWPWVQTSGIVTATTCDHGYNDRKTSPYGLKRFLDGANVHEIEFLAALSGIDDLFSPIRSLTNHFRKRRN